MVLCCSRLARHRRGIPRVGRAAQADAGTKQLGAVPWLAETTVGLKLLGLSQDQIDMAMSEKRRAQALQLTSSIAAAAGAAVTDPAMRSEDAAV